MSSKYARIWDKQLRLQVELSTRTDHQLFGRLPGWKAADQVADLGCGTGHFLARIAGRYRDKSYVAVEKNRNFLGLAKRRIRGRRLTTIHSTIESAKLKTASLDYANARLVLQHLPELAPFFREVGSAVRPGGYLLVLDAEDGLVRWSPELPQVSKALRLLSVSQRKSGIGRNGWAEIEKTARRYGFRKVLDEKLRYDSRDGQKRKFYEMFANLGRLLVQHFQLPLNEKAYRRELREWLKTSGSYGQFGMRAMLFKKRS